MSAIEIEGLLERAVQDRVVPGVVAVAGDRDGVLYEGAFGLLSVDGDVPIRQDTMIWIASMTKAIVSVAALQLIEQGSLDLEQTVEDVLPAFGELQVLEGFDGDEPGCDRRPNRRRFDTCSRTLPASGTGSPTQTCCDTTRLTGIPDPTAGRRALFEMPLVADPGTRWEYGISTDWLGQVIEAASGQDLATYCQAAHLQPARDGRRDLPTDRRTGRPNDGRCTLGHPMGVSSRRRSRARTSRSSGPAATALSQRPRTTSASCARCCAAASSTGTASCASRPSNSPLATTSAVSCYQTSSTRRSPN